MAEFIGKILNGFWETGNKKGVEGMLDSMRDIQDSLKAALIAKDEMIDSLMADIEGLKNEILVLKNNARIRELSETEEGPYLLLGEMPKKVVWPRGGRWDPDK